MSSPSHDGASPIRLDEPTQALLAVADRRVPARQATAEIDAQRMRSELAHGLGLSYEIVYEPQHGFGHLATVAAPKLVSYLSQKQMAVLSTKGVFVSLFVGEWLYFIEVPQFLEGIRRGERWSEAAFLQKVASWERGS